MQLSAQYLVLLIRGIAQKMKKTVNKKQGRRKRGKNTKDEQISSLLRGDVEDNKEYDPACKTAIAQISKMFCPDP